MSAVDVAIVGGGPAGASAAVHLARAGHRVAMIERSPEWHWRACGVFSSPVTVDALRRLQLDERTLAGMLHPIAAMHVEVDAGAAFPLTYGDDGSLAHSAVGFDRRRLDEALVALARDAGAEVRMGASVVSVSMGGATQRLSLRLDDGIDSLDARVVIGADGLRSTVARAAGVARPARLGRRIGLTFQARMVILPDAYCGLAPIPDGRLNVGIVLRGASWRGRLAEIGAAAACTEILGAIPRTVDDPVDWSIQERIDPIEGAVPLGHRVARRAGESWLLIGDAAGFLDPLTGEGLHRALISAELAAEVIDGHLRGRPGGLEPYARAMRDRFATKDFVTLVIQAVLARPALFRHVSHRLARDPALRETMGLVIGDLVSASRALRPGFLIGLFRP
jgi:flavin-dependent dehydrogenase